VNVKQSGFTLIEAVIVMAILGILAMIAWPMYEEQSQKSRRTDGVAALITAANEMEKCYSDNATYTGCDVDGTSSQGHYEITSVINADDYTLTATPVVADPSCGALTLNHLGVKGHNTTDNTPLQRCWGG
jgi:type IV pilus assembly protein PilE